MNSSAVASVAGQVRATYALLKFCRDHGHGQFFVGKLEECLEAIKANDRTRVIDIAKLFRRGGMGSFIDWYPSVISPLEEPEYLETIWWALTANWQEALGNPK